MLRPPGVAGGCVCVHQSDRQSPQLSKHDRLPGTPLAAHRGLHEHHGDPRGRSHLYRLGLRLVGANVSAAGKLAGDGVASRHGPLADRRSHADVHSRVHRVDREARREHLGRRAEAVLGADWGDRADQVLRLGEHS